MMYTIIILQCVIILMIYFTNINKKEEKKKILQEQEFQNINPHFIKGAKENWNLTTLALFKMYRDMDILDFFSLLNGLRENMKVLTTDKKELENWLNEYNEFIKEIEGEE